jgi:ribosome-associated protein
MAELRNLRVGPRRVIPARHLTARAVRSSGPGGQNVNKVATRIELTLDLDAATPELGATGASRIRQRFPRRLDADRNLVVRCDRTRKRGRNLEIAQDRMEEILREALAPPPPPRRATKPSAGSRRRRVDDKRRRGDTKRLRGRPGDD